MKKLNIPPAIVGLIFSLIGGVFVYLFVPPPSTATAGVECDGGTVFANNMKWPRFSEQSNPLYKWIPAWPD